MSNAADVIERLGLEPHPEGGWYRQTFADGPDAAGRPRSTAIYYLLEEHQISAWHRVDAVEIWHWHAGAPLTLRRSPDGRTVETAVLGNDLAAGEAPQLVVPAGCWQSARSNGAWTLVGCTVAPGFVFSGFEMAPEGWEPADGA
jgi:uncharacterized protein